MSPIRSVALFLLLTIAPLQAAFAQQSIRQQMTPEEFKAAGLDKLSGDELARLDAWLGRTLDAETARATTQATEKVQSEVRGFFNFGTDEPIASSIVGDFNGFQKGRHYKLANGQEWEQVEEASLAGVRKTDPKVRITPSVVGNAWYLAIDGYSTRAKVRRVK